MFLVAVFSISLVTYKQVLAPIRPRITPKIKAYIRPEVAHHENTSNQDLKGLFDVSTAWDELRLGLSVWECVELDMRRCD